MLFLSLLLWVAAALALFNRPTPSRDSFYDVPHNVSDYKYGDIIAVRPTPPRSDRSFSP